MKISVVIVNYNGKEYIKECVDSVLRSFKARGMEGNEVVVVENGSKDGSLEFLRKEYGRNKRVRMIKSKKNLFFCGGANLGAEKSKGEWLMFLNTDTVVDKNWLKELFKAAKRDSKLMLQPKIKRQGTDRIDCVIGKYIWPGLGIAVGRGKRDSFKGVVEGDYANGTALMVKRDWFFKLGGFEDSFRYFYEDVDLELRAKKQGGRAVGVMSAVIWHKGSISFKENVKRDEVLFFYRRNRLLVVRRNFRGVDKWVRWLGLVVSYVFLRKRGLSFKAVKASFRQS